jgi:hypothetical protein
MDGRRLREEVRMGFALWLARRRDRIALPAPSYAALSLSGDPRTVTWTRINEEAATRPRYILAADPDHSPNRLTIDELPLLRCGDQVFVKREIFGPPWEWIGAFLIRVGTFTRRDKRPTVANHVATVITELRENELDRVPGRRISRADLGRLGKFREGVPVYLRGPVVDWVIAEALGSGGFQFNRLLESYGDERKYSIAIARHKFAGADHREKIRAACERLAGKSYGYLKIGAHGLDYSLTTLWNAAGGKGDVYAFRWLCRMERYPMCSWSSLYIYERAGLPFDTPTEVGSPDDLYDECRRKALAVWIWPFWSRRLRSALLGDGFGAEHWETRPLGIGRDVPQA